MDSLQKANAVDELQVIITELNGMYEQKCRLEEKSDQLQKTNATLTQIEKD